jgi:predicted ATPase/class 3 adenylate cyclase
VSDQPAWFGFSNRGQHRLGAPVSISGTLPTGTVTFLFTDIEGSTRLVQTVGEQRYAEVLGFHDRIIRESIAGSGTVVKTIGDGFFAVFPDALAGVISATVAQRRLARSESNGDLKVRMGLHTGSGILGGDDYVGLDVHRASRIANAANGGQIVISASTAELVAPSVPEDIVVRSLGEHHLRDLSAPESLYQVDIRDHPMEFPPLRALDSVASNFPTQLTSFVGRQRELFEISEILDSCRLVTLTGPGGTGKTRLAMEVATTCVASFPDGAYFVPLEAIADPDLISVAILEALSMRTTTAESLPADHLIRYLADKKMLLILDNMEQILAAAPYVGVLLAAAHGIKIIVTSRAPLKISGEREYPVPPLAAPDTSNGPIDPGTISSFDSVGLFVERARAVQPDFRLTADNAETIANLVARLDALPLALELAASRINLLTPEAILQRLDNRLLSIPALDIPPRQRTITNAIGWSYDLLDEPVRRLFERCAVFVGDAALSDMEAVCGPAEELGIDVLEGLAVLVDHSLLRLTSGFGEPRYRMLLVVREFALGALGEHGELDEIQERHAHRYAGLASRAEPFLLTSHQVDWLDRLAADHENLRAAFDWSLEKGTGAIALELVGNLWRFWQTRGHLIEADERIDQVLSVVDGDPRVRAKAFEAKGGVSYWKGKWLESKPFYEEALALMRAHGTSSEIANALYNAAFPIGFTGDYDMALSYLAESQTLAEAAGDRLGVGRAYWGRCDLAAYQGDSPGSIRNALLAVAEFENLDAPFDLGWSLFMLAQAHTMLGDLEEARGYIDRGLPLFVASGDLSATVLYLMLKASLEIADGREALAAQLIGAGEALKLRTGAMIVDVGINQYDSVAQLSASNAPEIVEAIAAGRQMTVGEALALAMSV